LVNRRLSPDDGLTPLADCPGPCHDTYTQRNPGGPWLPM
jgi:hypothetical protein